MGSSVSTKVPQCMAGHRLQVSIPALMKVGFRGNGSDGVDGCCGFFG